MRHADRIRVIPTLRAAAAGLFAVAMLALAGCQTVSVPNPFDSAQDRPAEAQPPSAPQTAPGDATQIGPGIPETRLEPLVEAAPPEQVILTPPGGLSQRTRVAFLAPLSGPHEGVGRALLDAAQLGVFDVASETFELRPYDTQGTPAGARQAATAALNDGVQLILGPLFATSVTEVAPLAQGRGIKVIAFSNNRAVAQPGAFLVGLLPGEQVHRVVGYAAERGMRRFAALVPDTPFGRTVLREYQDAVALNGGELVKIEIYPAEEADLNAAVRRLAEYDARKQALSDRRRELGGRNDDGARVELQRLEQSETYGDIPYDALFVPASGAELRSIAALLPFYDIDTSKVRLLGTVQWSEPGLGREPALVGAWFAGPDPRARAELDRKFKDVYGYDAPDLAPLAYDAAALAAVLARSTPVDPFASGGLTAPNGFAGTAGIFRFLASGIPQRRLAVMQVEPWSVRVISPAGSTFADLAN